MKLIRSVFSAVILLCCAITSIAQGIVEKHAVTDKVAVAVTRGGPYLEERLVLQNQVSVTARHCQAYERHASRLWHWKSGIDLKACEADPTTVYFSQINHNLRTTAGGDWQASVMGNTSAPPATMNYIALSNDAGAPAAGDTTVASEIAANGLTRAQCTYAHTGGTAAFTCQKVFTATGTQASQKTGLLNASSSGTLGFENTYTQVTVNNGDTLTVTWTVNY